MVSEEDERAGPESCQIPPTRLTLCDKIHITVALKGLVTSLAGGTSWRVHPL